MIWPFRRTHTELDQADKVLEPFVSLSLTEIQELPEPQAGRFRILVECYIYGAVRYLVSYDDMQAGSSAVLMRKQLINHLDANDADVERCMTNIGAVRGGDEQLFMIEGASALRRWLVSSDQSSGRNLKRLLEIALNR